MSFPNAYSPIPERSDAKLVEAHELPIGIEYPHKVSIDVPGYHITESEQAKSQSIEPRGFRPDVEGLRAIAVALVVLYHAHFPGIRGGFVGVDIFFVISGFLITGLLLREFEQRGTISILGFYARRVRRILPAAAVVVIITIFAAYHWLGFLAGNSVADDARWTSIFLANIHFAFVGTAYFSSQAPPSPLLHMWSLGVEEQFYLVWPTLFLVIVALRRFLSTRLVLALGLGIIIVASFTWSVIETSSSSTWAYYSPFTRAWELAAGGLIAVMTPALQRIPMRLAAIISIVGLGGIVASGLVLDAQTPYPGSAVAFPVVSTAILIAAGTAVVRLPAERILALGPFQWLGARSYSLYLWHFPILTIASEYAIKNLSLGQDLLCVLGAVAAAALSYQFVENPIRHSRTLRIRPWLSITFGLCLIGMCLLVAQWQLATH